MKRAAILLLLVLVPSAAAAQTISLGDASISHNPKTGTWLLTAAGTTLTLAIDPARDFQVLQLQTESGAPWTIGPFSDSAVTVNDERFAFGSRSAGFVYRDVRTQVVGNVLQLDAEFDVPAKNLRITRHYRVTSGSPTFEVWDTYLALRDAAVFSDLTPFQATLSDGMLRWLTGLSGDNADTANDSAFTLQTQFVGMDEHFALGADGRSSERAIPMLSIERQDDEFYVALMWSGAWSMVADHTAGGVSLSVGLAPMTTTVAADPVDSPHVLFGVTPGGLTQVSAALRSYVLSGIRGRALMPLVTYNTWYAYGTIVDERLVRTEMERAASLGVEVFVLDAGWYVGVGAGGRWDFTSGLGSWSPDPVRFPSGLRALTEFAHSLGMRFGLWVEPERVALALVGAGIDESWLATSGGSYGSDQAAQVCFASPAARQWVMNWLFGLLDDVQPDYLKWDNNFWVNCDRPGHGHGERDGNFAHVRGLYDVFAALRSRYPDLLMENVSGGGNRLDLGMLQWSDVGWMSDRTAPSARVRHNMQGLSTLFPPAYLLSFVIDSFDEPVHRAPDMPLYFRSRMPGALGLSFALDGLSGSDFDAMANEIAIYKAMRSTLQTASASLLTAQIPAGNTPGWDVLQETSTGAVLALLIAVQTDAGVRDFVVRPTALNAEASYDVWSVDSGLLGTATGAELMVDGIDIVSSPLSAAHILMLIAKP